MGEEILRLERRVGIGLWILGFDGEEVEFFLIIKFYFEDEDIYGFIVEVVIGWVLN